MKSGEQLIDPAERVLSHIARYRLSFTEIIDHVCFRGQSSRKAMENLCNGKNPLVQKVPGFHGRRKAFTLTRTGSKAATGTVDRSKPPSDANINLLAFCCLAGRKRLRLEQSEIDKFFGKPLPGRHLVMQCSGNYCLHSVYTPGKSTKDQTILSKVEERLEELADLTDSNWNPTPSEWLGAGKLRVTAIVETPEKAKRLNTALTRRLEKYDEPAALHCSVVAANTNRLEELLRDLRPTSN